MANMEAVRRTARRLEVRESFESECVITAPGSGYVDEDGVWQSTSTPVYSGPCSFLPQQAVTRTVEAAGQQVELHPYKVKLPVNTTTQVDHVVQITACDDPDALGFYTVRAVQRSQWQVNRVLGCERGLS